MIKKRSMLLVALVLFTASLFAAPVVVTWAWMLEDPNVTTFRYQVDGENPDEWIVVDSSVTSYTVKGLDGSQEYTLYLQQSYDGENFSGSAKAVSEPIFPPEPAVAVAVADAEPLVDEAVEPIQVEEATMVADAEPVMKEEIVEPVADVEPAAMEMVVADAEPVTEEMVEPVVAEPMEAEAPMVAEEEAKADSRYKTTITLGGGFSHLYDAINTAPPTFNDNNITFKLGLQFKNMMTFNKTFGLGLDVGLAYTPYLSTSRGWLNVVTDIFSNFSGVMADFTQAGTVSIAPMLNTQLGKVGVDLGVGGFFTYGPDFISTENKAFMYGAFAKLGLAYQLNNWFSLGVDAKYNFVLDDFTAIKKFAEAGLYMGFSF